VLRRCRRVPTLRIHEILRADLRSTPQTADVLRATRSASQMQCGVVVVSRNHSDLMPSEVQAVQGLECDVRVGGNEGTWKRGLLSDVLDLFAMPCRTTREEYLPSAGTRKHAHAIRCMP